MRLDYITFLLKGSLSFNSLWVFSRWAARAILTDAGYLLFKHLEFLLMPSKYLFQFFNTPMAAHRTARGNLALRRSSFKTDSSSYITVTGHKFSCFTRTSLKVFLLQNSSLLNFFLCFHTMNRLYQSSFWGDWLFGSLDPTPVTDSRWTRISPLVLIVL